jgi:hypothetical protein
MRVAATAPDHKLVVASVLALYFALCPASADAARVLDRDDLSIDFGGDLKAFFDLSFPYEHLFMPEGLQPAAALDLRLRFSGRYKSWLSWEVHHSATGRYAATAGELFRSSLDSQPSGEGLKLSWSAYEQDGFSVSGRLDRASVAFHAPGFDVRFGRQPVSFGSGYFFTPLDLLSPYSPQVVDREYKPGVDAVRLDAFVGATGRLTGVLALVDAEDPDGYSVIGSGGFTVGVFDLEFFCGKHYRDLVLGFSTQGSAGPVGIHGDLALTVPFDGEDTSTAGSPTSVRVVVGADGRTDRGTTFMAEFYAQSFGSDDPEGYFVAASAPRAQRGDYWSLGHFYTALSFQQELLPVFSLGAVTIINLRDPSALIGPSLSWSIASNVDFVAGAFIAVGDRPPPVDLLSLIGPDGMPLPVEDALRQLETGSEFGLMPHQAYAQLKLYF